MLSSVVSFPSFHSGGDVGVLPSLAPAAQQHDDGLAVAPEIHSVARPKIQSPTQTRPREAGLDRAEVSLFQSPDVSVHPRGVTASSASNHSANGERPASVYSRTSTGFGHIVPFMLPLSITVACYCASLRATAGIGIRFFAGRGRRHGKPFFRPRLSSPALCSSCGPCWGRGPLAARSIFVGVSGEMIRAKGVSQRVRFSSQPSLVRRAAETALE